MERKSIKWRFACCLFCILLMCSLIAGLSYARFASAVGGTGIAHTAAVEMNTTLDLTEELQGMEPGEKREITFAVNNSKDGKLSDVVQNYSVSAATTGNLPLTFTLSPRTDEGQGGAYAGTLTKKDDPPVWSWSGGSLPHSAKISHTYTLTVEWPAAQLGESLALEIDLVTLTVEAKQGQPAAG